MRKILDQINKHSDTVEIIRFSINGGVSFLVDFSMLYMLTEFVGMYYLLSAAVSFSASVLVNYLLCINWVFQGEKNTATKAKIIFVATSIAGLGINQLFMWLLVDTIGLYYLFAKAAATMIVMVWNYITKKKAVYMK